MSRLEVISTPLEVAREFVTKEMSKHEGIDGAFPNFDKNYLFLQKWAAQGFTLRKDMPRVKNSQVKDFQKALKKGSIDLRAPFAPETDKNNLFPDGLTGDKAKEFFKAGKHDGDKHDDVVKTKLKMVTVGKIVPIQQQIYLDSAVGEKITSNGLAGFLKLAKKTKIITSADGFLIDGHHRSALSILIDPKMKLTSLIVDLPIKDLLKLARAYGAAKGNPPNESTFIRFQEYLKLNFS